MNRNPNGIRIAIDGNYLDEVRMLQPIPNYRGGIVHVSFPAARHWAHVKGEYVLIHAQPTTVVQLFADGVLPSIGNNRHVSVKIAEKVYPFCRLERVERDYSQSNDYLIILVFLYEATVSTDPAGYRNND